MIIFYCFVIFFVTTGLSTGVKIYPDVSEVVIKAGDTFNLTCRGQTPLQWQKNEYDSNLDNVASTSEVVKSEENGEYLLNIVIKNVYFMDTGYIYCFPNGSSIDNPEAAKIYLYVDDSENLFSTQEDFMLLVFLEHSNGVIPCKPTSPDVIVTLLNEEDEVNGLDVEFDNKQGFSFRSIPQTVGGSYTCLGKKGSVEMEIIYYVAVIGKRTSIPKPNITQVPSHVVIGENITLNCSCKTDLDVPVAINWTVPHDGADHIYEMPETLVKYSEKYKVAYKTLVIINATKEDEGKYVCNVADAFTNKNSETLDLKLFSPPYLNISLQGDHKSVKEASPGTDTIVWTVNIESNPQIHEILWYNPKGELIRSDGLKKKYEVINTDSHSELKVHGLTTDDTGVYYLKVNNDLDTKMLNVALLVKNENTTKLSSTT